MEVFLYRALYFSLCLTFVESTANYQLFKGPKTGETQRYQVCPMPSQPCSYCFYCEEGVLSDSTYKYKQDVLCNQYYRHKNMSEAFLPEELANNKIPVCNIGQVPGCGPPPQDNIQPGLSWKCDLGHSNQPHSVYFSCALICNYTNTVAYQYYCNESLRWELLEAANSSCRSNVSEEVLTSIEAGTASMVLPMVGIVAGVMVVAVAVICSIRCFIFHRRKKEDECVSNGDFAFFVYKKIIWKKTKKEESIKEAEPLNRVQTTEGNTSSHELQDMSTVYQMSSDVSEIRTTGPSTSSTISQDVIKGEAQKDRLRKNGLRIEVLRSYNNTSKQMHFNVLLVMKNTATDEYWTSFTEAIDDRFKRNTDGFETSCDSFVVYEPGPPSKPKGPLEVTDVTKNSAKLAWKEPEDDGGVPIDGYRVEKMDMENERWEPVKSTKKPELMVPKLLEGHQYKFRVIAESPNGDSEPLELGEPITAKNPFRSGPIVLQPYKRMPPENGIFQQIFHRNKKSETISGITIKFKLLKWETCVDLHVNGVYVIPSGAVEIRICIHPKQAKDLCVEKEAGPITTGQYDIGKTQFVINPKKKKEDCSGRYCCKYTLHSNQEVKTELIEMQILRKKINNDVSELDSNIYPLDLSFVMSKGSGLESCKDPHGHIPVYKAPKESDS